MRLVPPAERNLCLVVKLVMAEKWVKVLGCPRLEKVVALRSCASKSARS